MASSSGVDMQASFPSVPLLCLAVLISTFRSRAAGSDPHGRVVADSLVCTGPAFCMFRSEYAPLVDCCPAGRSQRLIRIADHMAGPPISHRFPSFLFDASAGAAEGPLFSRLFALFSIRSFHAVRSR